MEHKIVTVRGVKSDPPYTYAEKPFFIIDEDEFPIGLQDRTDEQSPYILWLLKDEKVPKEEVRRIWLEKKIREAEPGSTVYVEKGEYSLYKADFVEIQRKDLKIRDIHSDEEVKVEMR